MEIKFIKDKIERNGYIPDQIKIITSSKNCQISTSILTTKRVISLYELRVNANIEDENYKQVNLELQKVINSLRESDINTIAIISIINPEKYFQLFSDDKIEKIFGILDLTGLGGTNKYITKLFPK